MKHSLLSVILSFALTSSWAQEQDSLLLEAYRTNSSEKLERFFNNWVRESSPISSAEMNKFSDTAREVYRVFQEFYNPLKLERIGGSEWGNHVYDKVKYFVVQNEIHVGFVENLDKDSLLLQKFTRLSKKLQVSVDSVKKGYTTNRRMMKNFRFEWPEPDKNGVLYNFWPRVSFQNPTTVILTAKYDSLLNQFLGNSHYPLGAGDLMSPAAAMGESAGRQKFLEDYIKIWYGHWGGYWQIYSYPYVDCIVFDKTLNYALVNFRLVYEGGYAYLKKINRVWVLVEAGRTWIE